MEKFNGGAGAFFMACEELFSDSKGNEWYVCHYRLIKRS